MSKLLLTHLRCVSVIPRAELEKKSYIDVTDALKDIPGVVITGGGSSSDISIRGMGGSYTLFLVDGKRVSTRETRPNSDNSGIEQGWLPPLDAIERIEVVRGPMSSLYGSEAMGGVVNIITRKVRDKWVGTVSAETTKQENSLSGDIYQGDFFVGGPIKNDTLGLQVSGKKFRRNEDKILSGFNEQDIVSGHAKITLTPNKNNDISFEVGRVFQERVSMPGKSMAILGNNGKPNDPSYANYDKTNYALAHTGRLGFGTINTYLQRDNIDNVSRNMFLENTDFNSQLAMPMLDGRHMATIGLAWKDENLIDFGNLNPNAKDLQTLSHSQKAFFVEDEWAVTDVLSVTGGLRLTDDEKYGKKWTPRIYGVWKATPNLNVKGGISSGFKAPGLRQTVAEWGQRSGGGSGNGDPIIILGNPNLQPEESLSQELGIVWDNKKNISSSLTIYNTDFKNKIVEEIDCSNATACAALGYSNVRGVRHRVNIGEAQMRGLEATHAWDVNGNVKIIANYTFTKTEQKSGVNKGQSLNQMPRHMINATVDWKWDQKISTWARLNFRSKTSKYEARAGAMGESTPSYAFVDFGMNYALTKSTKVSAGVYNIFDKIVDPEAYNTILDGRRYWMKVSTSF